MIHNSSSISLYKKNFGEKPYQLISIIRISPIYKYSYNEFLKLDNKTLLITDHEVIYFFDVKKIKIIRNPPLIKEFIDIKFIYKIENNIYIYDCNHLYIFQYSKNSMNQKGYIKADELITFNYLLNLSVHSCYTNLSKYLIIKYIENKNENENKNKNENTHFCDCILDSAGLETPFPPSSLPNSPISIVSETTRIRYILGFMEDNYITNNEEEKVFPYDKRFFKLFKKNKYKCKKREIKNNSKYKKNYR